MIEKPTIRTKTRDPKSTDFSKNELIININKGTLFYKTNLGVHKITPTSTITATSGVDGVDGLPGQQGENAVTLSISSNSNLFSFDDSLDLTPTPTDVTITAIQNNQANDLVDGSLITFTNAVKSNFASSITNGTGVATWTITPDGTGTYPITCTVDNDGISKSIILHKVSGGDEGVGGVTTTINVNTNTTDSYFNDQDNDVAATIATSNISFNGNIGIGDFGTESNWTTPTDKLQVQDGNIRLGKTTTQGILYSQDETLTIAINDGTANNVLDYAYIELKKTGIQQALINMWGDLNIKANASLGPGNLGDGKLQTDGDAVIGGTCTANALVTDSSISFTNFSAGAGSAGSHIFLGSDRRLKKNINSMEDSLSKILSLRGVNFEWKDKNLEGIHSGFIAQELEEIIPEAVGTNKDSGIQLGPNTTEEHKTLTPITLIPFLVESIKEQQKQIDELKEKIK